MSDPNSSSNLPAKASGLKLFPLDYASIVGFLAYSSSVTATPICLVAISRELSLSLSKAGGLEATRSVLVIVSLLLSGFIAAKLGKVRALGWSSLLLGLGMICYSLSPSYGILLIALSLLGLSGGVVEALINPLVQELHPKDSGRYLNLTNAFWSIGLLLTMIGTGELLSRDIPWRSIIAGLGSISFLSGTLFLCLRHSGMKRERRSMAFVLQQKWAILRATRFWLFASMMFFGGAAEGAFTYWSASLLQIRFGAAPRAAGIGVALFALGMILARLGFAWWIPQNRLWHLISVSAISGVVVSILIPLIDTITMAYCGLFLSGISVACFWPSLQSHAVDRLDFDPTGLFILLSCGGIAGFAMSSWIMGIIGDRFDLQSSFWVIPFCFAGLLALLFVERKRAAPES